jgi:hypothetical protein
MKIETKQGLAGVKSQLRLIPYVILGLGVFAFNSSTDLNYFLRGYLVLLESQIGIVVLYFIIAKIIKRTKGKQPQAIN